MVKAIITALVKNINTCGLFRGDPPIAGTVWGVRPLQEVFLFRVRLRLNFSAIGYIMCFDDAPVDLYLIVCMMQSVAHFNVKPARPSGNTLTRNKTGVAAAEFRCNDECSLAW